MSVVNEGPSHHRFNSINKTKSRVVVILENESNKDEEEDKVEVVVMRKKLGESKQEGIFKNAEKVNSYLPPVPTKKR